MDFWPRVHIAPSQQVLCFRLHCTLFIVHPKFLLLVLPSRRTTDSLHHQIHQILTCPATTQRSGNLPSWPNLPSPTSWSYLLVIPGCYITKFRETKYLIYTCSPGDSTWDRDWCMAGTTEQLGAEFRWFEHVWSGWE